MSLLDHWSICDRCGFKYRRRQLRKEANNLVVCQTCYDGKYDSLRHPQNRPFRQRREMLPIPDARPQDQVPILSVALDGLDGFLLTEAGEILQFESTSQYNIGKSIYIRVV